MDAALGLAIAVGIFTADEHGGALDSGGFARQDIGYFELPAPRLSPALIHAHQHVRPIAGLGAARPRIDAHDAIALIVPAAEENFKFQGIEVFEEFGNVTFEFL